MRLDNPNRDIDKAIQYLTESAENGYSIGYRYLGWIYSPIEHDYGKIKNIDLAIDYLKKAAEMKDADASNSLGVLYGDYKNKYYDAAYYTMLAHKYNSYNKIYNENYQNYRSRLTEQEQMRLKRILLVDNVV